MLERAVALRVERTWADDAVEFAEVLARLDPSWGSEWFALADGTAVLHGPGLYVNRALATGLTDDVTIEHLERLEARSAAVGVEPAIEASEYTKHGVVALLAARGYEPSDPNAALTRPLDLALPEPEPAFVIETAATDALLPVWQEVCAVSWGHTTESARKACDTFATVASIVDGPGLLLARDASDGRAVGCASLTVRNGLGTLGGMSTLPSERRRGVQAALIGHRLHLARSLGCDLAAVNAAAGSDSERNLMRHGFVRSHTRHTYSPSAK